MNNPTPSRELSAFETIIAILENRKPRPKPGHMQMLIDDAKSGVERFRRLLAERGN